MQKARFLIVNLPKLIVHIEPSIKPKEKDRKQKTITMPGQKRGRWEMNLKVPTMVGTI